MFSLFTEIASYRIRTATAEYVGDKETVAVCQRILYEEFAMVKWPGSGPIDLTRCL